jgi:transposase
VGAPNSYGTIANDPAAVRKLLTRLGGPNIELRVAYEAGPTGYTLHRQPSGLNIACLVVAPSLVPQHRATRSRPIAATRSSWRGCCAAVI